MKQFLKTLTFRLTAMSPVFVGGGGVIGKKEYILPPSGKDVIIPDLHKMYNYLDSLGKSAAYEDFLLARGGRDSNSLFEFLRSIGVGPADYKKFTDYIISKGDVDRVSEINTFVKDPYGYPFIPGSGLKGSLRTAFVGSFAAMSPEKYGDVRESMKREDGRNRNTYMQQPAATLEEKIFAKLPFGSERGGRDNFPLKDIMRGLRIGDSKPLSAKDLVLCQKVDISLSGKEKPINTLRECLKPGTEILFPVTLDEGMFLNKENKPYTAEEIMETVSDFYRTYKKAFLNSFGASRNYGNCLLYIGGGTGYATKTVVYPLFGEGGLQVTSDILKQTTLRNHDHGQDVDVGVSPRMKKCTRYANNIHEFGVCAFSIESGEHD